MMHRRPDTRERGFRILVLGLLIPLCGGCGKDTPPATTGATRPPDTPSAVQSEATENNSTPTGAVLPPRERPDEPLPEGVVLHLSFDTETICRRERRGYVRDLSENQNDARIRGVTLAEGRFGEAAEFNGHSAFLDGSDAALPSGSSPSTISLWFNVRRDNFQFVFTYGTEAANAARGMALLRESGLCFFRWVNAACDVETDPIETDQWHHWLVTYDGTQATFYLDGENQGSRSRSFETVLDGYLVGKSYDTGDYLKGRLDELIVFDRVLSESEMMSLYERTPYPVHGSLSFEQVAECP